MDYAAIARETGCIETALPDIVRRCEGRFAGEEPSPQVVSQWLQGELRSVAGHLWPPTPTLPQTPWGKLGVPQEVWEGLSPSTKLAMARQLQLLPPARPRRPERYTATPEQLESIEGLSPMQRLTAYRQWQAEAQQG